MIFPQAISTLPVLQRLTLSHPSPHPAEDVNHPVSYPRITPGVQLLALPGMDSASLGQEVKDAKDHATRLSAEIRFRQAPQAVGMGGSGLGLGWENLEELELNGLSLIGVSSFDR